jgi:hypothetical protein
MKLLTQKVEDVFGKISPPPGMDIGAGDPVAQLAKLLGLGVRIFLIIAGLAVLIYMLWGAFDWIISSGEKERLQKAQNKITNAVIGLLLIFAVLTIFGLLTGDILGIIVNTPQGWELRIPTIK